MYHGTKRNFTNKLNYEKGVKSATQKCRLLDTLETEFYAINKFLIDNPWLDEEEKENCIDRMKNILSGCEVIWKEVFEPNDPVVNRKWEQMILMIYRRTR